VGGVQKGQGGKVLEEEREKISGEEILVQLPKDCGKYKIKN
jgi:hypothetical protein